MNLMEKNGTVTGRTNSVLTETMAAAVSRRIETSLCSAPKHYRHDSNETPHADLGGFRLVSQTLSPSVLHVAI